MAIFENNMIFVLNNLGIIDFTKTVEEKENLKQKKQEIFYLSLSQERQNPNGDVLQGKMLISDNGYVLLKGSYIESEPRPSFITHNYYNLRQKLESSNCFKPSEIKDVLMTKEDIFFKSPSAAAAVVKNRATNGRAEWKLADGLNLDEFEIQSKS